jgi:hypothetical protein
VQLLSSFRFERVEELQLIVSGKPDLAGDDAIREGPNDFGVSDLAPCDLNSRGVLDSNWGPLRLQQYQRYVF